MSSFELETCNVEEFVAEVTAQAGSLEEAASTQEILSQQIEGYLNRLKAAMCADLEAIQVNCCGGTGTFLELDDTPASYAGAAGDVATVNAGETALEFTTPSAGGGLPDLDDDTEVSSGRQFNGTDTYFKLINIGTLPNTATKSVAHNIGASFTVVSCYGAANDPSTPRAFPLPFVSTSFASNQISVTVDSTNVNVITGANRTAFTASWIILEYYYN